MADKVRIGMIGVGQIGKRHVQGYWGEPGGPRAVPDAEIVAICDINEAEANRVAAMYGVKDVYTDYKELLKRDDIQSVDVALHNRFHMPVTVDALHAGKNVYCEKPMSWTYRDAKKMYDTAKETGRMLHIQLSSLYSPDARGAKRLIEEGHLGDVYFAKAIHYRRRGRPWVDGYGSPAFVNTSTSGGGAMLDMAVYHIARMVWLLGNPDLVSVAGKTYQEIDMYADRRASGKYDVEELGMGFIRMANDITFVMEESWAIHANDPNEDRVYGSKGGLRVDPLEFYTTIADMELDGTFDVKQAAWRWGQCDPLANYYTGSQIHWVAAQQGKVPLLDTAGIALKTAFITEGVYVSSHLGREVTAEEIENAEPGLGRV
ncbi:MAG: Gfo/Idh/MocA family protein [Anaerolineae bacterium]|jgi:predicted dehydrogenase